VHLGLAWGRLGEHPWEGSLGLCIPAPCQGGGCFPFDIRAKGPPKSLWRAGHAHSPLRMGAWSRALAKKVVREAETVLCWAEWPPRTCYSSEHCGPWTQWAWCRRQGIRGQLSTLQPEAAEGPAGGTPQAPGTIIPALIILRLSCECEKRSRRADWPAVHTDFRWAGGQISLWLKWTEDTWTTDWNYVLRFGDLR
jgi:hypothetical protein